MNITYICVTYIIVSMVLY